jgi:oligoribonuclease
MVASLASRLLCGNPLGPKRLSAVSWAREAAVDGEKSATNLVWLDLETSGLDVDSRVILEIATVITDKDLRVLAEGPDLVIHHPTEVLSQMDAWCRKQHRASGLLDEVRRSTVTLEQAEAQTLDIVSRYCPPRACPLCGNSICFDRRFLIRHMPHLDARLSYRNVDVSTLKELASRWMPQATEGLGDAKSSKHRARSDILESIEELRQYRRLMFK